MTDRCLLVPPHVGYHTAKLSERVGNFSTMHSRGLTDRRKSLSCRLLRFVGQSPARVAIADAQSAHERTHLKLLFGCSGFTLEGLEGLEQFELWRGCST
jgi:hypothetical protein